MGLPGFGAERALYKTSGHYQMTESHGQTGGIVPAFFHCGSCYREHGKLVRTCTICVPCPPGVLPNGCGGCETYTVPCSSGESH